MAHKSPRQLVKAGEQADTGRLVREKREIENTMQQKMERNGRHPAESKTRTGGGSSGREREKAEAVPCDVTGPDITSGTPRPPRIPNQLGNVIWPYLQLHRNILPGGPTGFNSINVAAGTVIPTRLVNVCRLRLRVFPENSRHLVKLASRSAKQFSSFQL